MFGGSWLNSAEKKSIFKKPVWDSFYPDVSMPQQFQRQFL
jgi:hypothetical protein